jgi:hypothetical protein
MSAKKTKPSLEDQVQVTIDHVQEILQFQASNGLVTIAEAESIQSKLEQAIAQLASDANKANTLAQGSLFELVDKLNAKPRRLRLIYMYGLHIWGALIALTAILLVVLAKQTLNFSIFQEIPMDTIAWGGLGGCAYSIYHLRQNVYEFKLSKYYAVYWFVYPLAGMIFGLAISFIVASGLLSLQAKPSYAVYATIAFLAGTFQEWIISTLKDVAEAIHKTK